MSLITESGDAHSLVHRELAALGLFEILMNTPKAFANFSPGLERSDNPGKINCISGKP
jgi:hypothetical protein